MFKTNQIFMQVLWRVAPLSSICERATAFLCFEFPNLLCYKSEVESFEFGSVVPTFKKKQA